MRSIGIGTIIKDTVIFGKNVSIGYNCVIEDDCEIGDGTVIEHFVLLKKGTKIGKNCFVDSYVRSSGDNKIGNNVTLRFGCTIAREVTIWDNVFISPNVMTIYSNPTGEKVGGTVIGAGAYIGTAAVIGPGVKIAPEVVVGAQAFVDRSLSERGTYVGVPVRKL